MALRGSASTVDDQLLGNLLSHQAGAFAGGDQLVEGQIGLVGSGLDHCADSLATVGIRKSDDGGVSDLRQLVQHAFLDLRCGDVLPLADDDVLESPGEGDVAVVVHHAEIAGAEAALLVEGACFERWVGVALEQHWSSDAHLALSRQARRVRRCRG